MNAYTIERVKHDVDLRDNVPRRKNPDAAEERVSDTGCNLAITEGDKGNGEEGENEVDAEGEASSHRKHKVPGRRRAAQKALRLGEEEISVEDSKPADKEVEEGGPLRVDAECKIHVLCVVVAVAVVDSVF